MRTEARVLRIVIAILVAVCSVALGLAPVSSAFAVTPAASYVVSGFWTDPLTGPGVGFSLDPPQPDGYFGWYVSLVRVALTAERPATVRFAWDDPSGPWLPYTGPLLVPEGKHVLYAQADDGLARGPVTALQVKVDFRSRPVKTRVTRVVRPAAGNAAVVSVRATVNPWAGPRVVRVAGPDRYGTCAEIAMTDFTVAPTAIVARGDDFPDALAAAGLAGLYNAPIVLARPDEMPFVVGDALVALGTRNAIIVGSVRAVSSAVESQLKVRGMTVERIGGADRYETAALIARGVVTRGGQRGAAFVARGDLYPDSLAVAPFAYRARRPILLVRPTSVPAVTTSALGDLGISDCVIAGSDRAVSSGVETAIEGITGRPATRAQGEDRYGTSIAAARYGVASGLGTFAFVGIATGQNFPDALCGGAAVGAHNGVILMTPKDRLHEGTAAELASHGPELRDIQVYGSEFAVSRAAWDGIVTTIR